MHSRSVQFNIVTEHRPRRQPSAHSRSLHTFTKQFHWHYDTYRCHITLSPWTPVGDWHSWAWSTRSGAARSTLSARSTAASRALVYIPKPPIIHTLSRESPITVRKRTTFKGAEGVIDKAVDSISTRGCCSERRARNTCGARLYTECGMRAAATSPGLPASTALVEPWAIISRHLLPSGE